MIFAKAFVCVWCMIFLIGCIKSSSGTNNNLVSFSDETNTKGDIKDSLISLTPNDYVDWYQKNRENLVVYSDTLNTRYSLEYRPSEIEAINVSDINNSWILDSVLKVKSNYSFFIFSISPQTINQNFKELSDSFIIGEDTILVKDIYRKIQF